MTEPIEPPVAGGPVEDWPVGQLAEIDWRSSGSDETRTFVVRRASPDEAADIRDSHWESLAEEWVFEDGPEVTAVRPLRLVPQDAERLAPNRVRPSDLIIVGGRMTAESLGVIRSVEDGFAEAVRAEAQAAERARLRARVLAIPAGSYRRDLGFDAAISRVLEVLDEAGQVTASVDRPVRAGDLLDVLHEDDCEHGESPELCSACDGPESVAAPSVGTEWRVGEHYDIHVYEGDRPVAYEGDRPVATFHRPEDAARAVAAVNASVGTGTPASHPAVQLRSDPTIMVNPEGDRHVFEYGRRIAEMADLERNTGGTQAEAVSGGSGQRAPRDCPSCGHYHSYGVLCMSQNRHLDCDCPDAGPVSGDAGQQVPRLQDDPDLPRRLGLEIEHLTAERDDLLAANRRWVDEVARYWAAVEECLSLTRAAARRVLNSGIVTADDLKTLGGRLAAALGAEPAMAAIYCGNGLHSIPPGKDCPSCATAFGDGAE